MIRQIASIRVKMCLLIFCWRTKSVIKVLVTSLAIVFFPLVANAATIEKQKTNESVLIAQIKPCNWDDRCRKGMSDFYRGFGGGDSSSPSQQAPQPSYCSGKGCSTVRTGGNNGYPQQYPNQYNRRPVYRRY